MINIVRERKMQDFIKVALPREYNLVVGDVFQLFYRGVVEAPDPFYYDIVASCEKGKNYPRYFEFLPEEEGVFELLVAVYDANKNLLGSAVTKLNVKKPVKPAKEVNILAIGDSLTVGGEWVGECNRRISKKDGLPQGLGIDNVNFIGTCERNGVCFEGYGGWEWKNFLLPAEQAFSAVWIECEHNKNESDQHSLWVDEGGNPWQLETIEEGRIKLNRLFRRYGAPKPEKKLSHSDNAKHREDIIIKSSYYAVKNPFYNEETESVDLKNYCEKNNFSGIDFVYILLGWNGLLSKEKSREEQCRAICEEGKQLVYHIHKAYPDSKIRIIGLQIPSVNGGIAANYGATLPQCDDYGTTKYVLELNRAYEKWTLEDEYKDYMKFINLSGQFDSDNNMPSEEKCVNVRSNKKEIVGTNGVHPAIEGYMQIADAVFRSIVCDLAEMTE